MIWQSREKRSLKDRHTVLKALFFQNDMEPNLKISSNKLHKLTNLRITEIEKQSELLVGSGEVTTTYEGEIIYVTLTDEGKRAYLDEKYLKLAYSNTRQNLEFFVKIIIPIAALIVSIISLINSCNTSKRLSQSIPNQKIVNQKK